MGVAPSIGNGVRLYVQEGDKIAGAPAIWIMFSIDGNSVEIVAVKLIEAYDEADEDG